MLTLVQDRPAASAPASKEATLRAELDTLNAELKELKSTEFAVRAYVETWIAMVALLASSKLLFDWQKMHSKPPVVAAPLILLGLLLLTDSLIQRLKQRKLAKAEEQKLQRQRELRRQLGVDEAVFPASQAA